MRRASSILVAAVLVLLCLGIVILASTSGVKANEKFGDPNFFFKRQLVWLLLSVCLAALLARFDYHWWQRAALPLGVATVAMLVLVLVPGIGTLVGGARRWLRVGPVGFQPSEFAKFALIVVLAAWMSRVGRRTGALGPGLLAPCALIGLFALLTIMEPDFGTTLLAGMVGLAILYAGGVPLLYLSVVSVLGLCAFAVAIAYDPVRMGRILAFLQPEKYPATAYHLAQSKVAFIRGGLFGVGLGNSMQKQFYLPEAHTDFIFAIIGEELGLLATGGVVLLFLAVLLCGMWISHRAPDPFGKLLGFGVTMMITLQAAINIGVVTGCLPTKGLALPFISYGGSSLMVSVIGVAVLLNIAWHGYRESRDAHTRPIKDCAHWF